ncbi:hypothetical protein AAFF_G00376910 [Aldrovandia affinis]|uniref:C2H2-type domain-containing protein n=1 Tax=Aldrovandia affinis TaxID=143900 RepID=A0AAD7SFN1_9TELE|nr:hypothetical protein AAFF_G00376910 [Aldrovandia affinis]
MSTNGSPATSALVSELSFSFQDELTATIHNAFGVAVEIAVLEITKLVGQALGDVRDQMHETLRENKSLKQRLQSAELEVCALRGRINDESNVQSVTVGGESKSSTEPQEVAATKGNIHNLFPVSQVDRVQFDAAQSQTTPGVDITRTLIEGQSLPDAVCHKSEVEQPLEVKEESPDLACASVQTPGRLETRTTASTELRCGLLIPCTSHTLSNSTIFNPEIPDVLSPTASGMPLPFSKPYPPGATAGISISDQPFSRQMSGPNSKMPSGTHACKVCGDVFHLAGELRKHRAQHHNPATIRNAKRPIFPPGRSPYHCSQCGRDFNRMEHLKIHQRIHTGERPYACSVCNARFRHSWALTRHFRIHTGEKPYVCNQCGKTFRNCGGLRFHQRSHSMGGVA